MAQMARFAMEFCAVESCGKCTPCRIGSTRGVEIMGRIVAARDVSPVEMEQAGSGYLDGRDEIGRAHAELQSLMRISYAVFCLKKKNTTMLKTKNTQMNTQRHNQLKE